MSFLNLTFPWMYYLNYYLELYLAQLIDSLENNYRHDLFIDIMLIDLSKQALSLFAALYSIYSDVV